MRTILTSLLLLVLIPCSSTAQDCIGAQIYSQEAFQYGRFEVAMRSAAGDGVVSSFFLYNLDTDCNWPAENNELDIEMTGNTENLYFTTHYPGPWFYTDIYSPAFNPHTAIHEYAFEWEPGIVRWFVDGNLVNVQDQVFVADLIYPMRIMMNLWASEATTWVGNWDPSVMPVSSEYEYVRYAAYTPGNGNTGTGNNFTLTWEDELNTFDENRWIVEQDGGFVGNYCRFRSSSIDWTGGKMIFKLEEAPSNPVAVPVTFSVNTEAVDLSAGDVVYLNSSFNNWCGNCMPMTQNGDVWSRTESLLPGSYEYLFTINTWEEIGGPPQGSECDFLPCDEFNNYGHIVVNGSGPTTLATPCWGTCTDCSLTTSLKEPTQTSTPRLLKVFDLLGREISSPQPGQVILKLYEDGTSERSVFWGE